MDDFPEKFQQTVQAIFQEAGVEWLATLPRRIARMARRWQLSDLVALPLSINYVAAARRVDGSRVVLKMGVPHPNAELLTEIAALRRFGGRGMVRLLEVDAAEGALLLEYLQPGQTLATLADDDAAMRIAAQVMKRFWTPAEAGEPPFPMVAKWASGLQRMRARFGGGTGPLPERRVARAEGLFADLLAEGDAPVLLHGDLHQENILASAREEAETGLGWCAIDPKGVVGSASFEVTPLFFNPWPVLPSDADLRRILARRADVLAESLGFERQRLLGWAEARAVLSAWWTVEDHGSDWADALRVAAVLEGLQG